MIVETVTTKINPDGTVNCAAMGVEWGDEAIVIKPYRATRTLRNLERSRAAVVNLTAAILLFAQAALDDPHPPTRPAEVVEGAVLADACSWREVAVEDVDATGARARVTARVVGRGTGREYVGWNRASHAVLYGGRVELTVDAGDDELEAIVERVPSSSSKDHGEPFGKVLKDADWAFYKIDPLLFSPAEVSLVSVQSGRSFHAGGVDRDVLERSFDG